MCATCAHGVADAAVLCKRASRAHELPLDFVRGGVRAAGDAAAAVFLCNTVASRAGEAVADDEVTGRRVLAIPKFLFVYTPPRRDGTAGGATQSEAEAEQAPVLVASVQDASAEDWDWLTAEATRGGAVEDRPH